jgi:hypothetical protein
MEKTKNQIGKIYNKYLDHQFSIIKRLKLQQIATTQILGEYYLSVVSS